MEKNRGLENSFKIFSSKKLGEITIIKVGQRKQARYWGDFTVEKVAKLRKPIMCQSKVVGDVEFMPTLVKINWATSPSLDKNEFWFPYWVRIKSKEKYGQFAPMIGQNGLLELLKDAIQQDFFDKSFLVDLEDTIHKKIKTMI